MPKLYNLARMTTATTLTGTVTLGSAVAGFLTFAQAGVPDGAWVRYGIKDGTGSEEGIGKYTASGTTLTRNVRKSTNSDALLSLSGAAEVFIMAAAEDLPFPDNHLTGLTIAPSTTTFAVAAGVAADTTNTDLMRLTSAITKSTSAWAVGSGNGGLDTGSIAATPTWYHVWLIMRPDTGVVDVLLSLSASSPTMPTNYTLKRRIGALKVDGSSHFYPYTQSGDYFYWTTTFGDVNDTALSTTGTLYVLGGVPTGINTVALFRAYVANATIPTVAVLTSPLESDQAVESVPGQRSIQLVATGAAPAHFQIMTDTSAQIRAVSNRSSTTIAVATFGWIDFRGKV